MGKYIVILFQISSLYIIQIGAMQHYTAAIGNLYMKNCRIYLL